MNIAAYHVTNHGFFHCKILLKISYRIAWKLQHLDDWGKQESSGGGVIALILCYMHLYEFLS